MLFCVDEVTIEEGGVDVRKILFVKRETEPKRNKIINKKKGKQRGEGVLKTEKGEILANFKIGGRFSSPNTYIR